MATTHSSIDINNPAGPSTHIDDDFVDPNEGRRMFDEAVREAMGISGAEFIRRYDAGEYREIADKPGSLYVGDLIALIPFARQDP